MNTRRRCVFALALALFAGVLTAGPLTPPGGPVAGSYKTLSEVEPRTAINATNSPGDADSMFKITSPGSYYLTGNLDTLPGKMGIEIVADDVTIDLGGFRIGGYPGALSGIKAVGTDRRNLCVRNGSVWTMSGDGVNLAGDSRSANGFRVENLSVRGCAGAGLALGDEALAVRVDASGNGGTGIDTGRGCGVSDCTAAGNGSLGIRVGEDCTITSCTTSDNSGTGIETSGRAVVRGCTSSGNGGLGIDVFSGSNVSQCSAALNVLGGIDGGLGGVVESCSAFDNDGYGINMSNGTVTGCSVRDNSGDGILASGSLVRDNSCTHNGLSSGDGANIHIHYYGSRVEGNVCIYADRGIDCSADGNIIVRNSCQGNTVNWKIVAGNVVAPIVTVPTNGGLINGNTYAGSVGSTDPNANLTF